MPLPFSITYEPGESLSELFGGNSNWRGPVWMPGIRNFNFGIIAYYAVLVSFFSVMRTFKTIILTYIKIKYEKRS